MQTINHELGKTNTREIVILDVSAAQTVEVRQLWRLLLGSWWSWIYRCGFGWMCAGLGDLGGGPSVAIFNLFPKWAMFGFCWLVALCLECLWLFPLHFRQKGYSHRSVGTRSMQSSCMTYTTMKSMTTLLSTHGCSQTFFCFIPERELFNWEDVENHLYWIAVS